MRKLDIRGCDLQTEQRVKLLALWQANQDKERVPMPSRMVDSLLVIGVACATVWAGLMVLWVLGGDF